MGWVRPGAVEEVTRFRVTRGSWRGPWQRTRPSPDVAVRVRVRRRMHWAMQAIRRGLRWLERRYWPGARGTAVITAGVTLAVCALTVLLVVHINWWSGVNEACHSSEFGCHLGSHLIVEMLAAGIGAWIFLRGEAAAARSWRKTVRRRPEWLFLDWLSNPDGLTGDAARASEDASPGRRTRREAPPPIAVTAIGRDDLASAVIAELNETGDAQILVGDSGAGKTVLLMKIAEQLAKQGQVPIAITLRSGSSNDIEQSARGAFIATVTGTARLERAPVRRARAKDHEQAEKWWNWLRRRSLITVLVDDLEKDERAPALRVQALERAASQHLRLIVASRSYGLPPDYRRGRIEVTPIDQDELVEDLAEIVRQSGVPDVSAPSRATIADLVERADIGRTPYYLAIARVLAGHRLFPDLDGVRDARVALLDAYRDGLLTRRLASTCGLSSQTRASVLHQLEAVAFACILGFREEADVAAQAAHYRQPPAELSYQEVFDLARRLTILESRYDGMVHFAHPTTLAYCAARFMRDASEDSAREQIAGLTHLSAMVITALTLAAAGDEAMVRWCCTEFLRRITRTSPTGSEIEPEPECQEKLALCAAAAEMLATLDRPDPRLISQIAQAARSEAVVGQRLVAEKKRVVAALSRLGAYDELWAYARDHQEYPVRREASRLLVEAGPARATLIDQLASIIETADQERRRRPAHLDDDDPVFDELKAVGWIFASLRRGAGEDRRELLDGLQALLIDLSLDQGLTVQRGLEASVAQGLKLAARRHVGEFDPHTEAMLDHPKGPPAFWYSRVMLAQALALQAVPGHDSPVPDARRQHVDRRLALLADGDPHRFVRETARLCRRAVARGRWEPYIWTDAAEIVNGVPRGLGLDAAQLAGDIVIALNLNAHQGPEMRRRFGAAEALPGCLRPGGAREAIVGRDDPPGDCPLDQRSHDEKARGAPVRCACPYLYNSTDLKIDARRELSRAFCRHQRMNARPPLWQHDTEVKALRRFWDHMENLARF
jgi:hypothetical protein